MKKKAWGLQSDLDFSSRYLADAWGRFLDGESFGLVVTNLFQNGELAYALIPLGVGIIAARVLRVPIPPAAWFPFATAALYLLGIILVYLGTPYELSWHLNTSAGRTALPIFVTLSAATFLVLDAIEDTRALPGGEGR
jgi:hypothetical protein